MSVTLYDDMRESCYTRAIVTRDDTLRARRATARYRQATYYSAICCLSERRDIREDDGDEESGERR